MIFSPLFSVSFLLAIRSLTVDAQSAGYTAYQTSFPFVTTCSSRQYFDTALLQCSPCPANTVQKSTDPTQCDCDSASFYYGVNQGGGSLTCLPCGTNYIRSTDGFGCVRSLVACPASATQVLTESALNGDIWPTSSSLAASQPRTGDTNCILCSNGTQADPNSQRCSPCAKITPRTSLPSSATIQCCSASEIKDGICLTYVTSTTTAITETLNFQNRFSSPTASQFIQQHLEAAFYLCRMNLNFTTAGSPSRTLLSNATACQVLANIATMQLFYSASGYAYSLYDNYIWQSQITPSVWTTANIRTSIPFLTYPSGFYNELISSSYNWIPATLGPNDLINFKLAKYSPTGQFLGLFDAVDAQMQLCGGGYSDGRSAFTFGAQYTRSCNIRADALWSSPQYDTAFFDPYLVFTRSGANYMIPTPVVVTNYQTSTGSSPNQVDDESLWTYHRRFFLIDRVSGIDTSNVLRNLRYVKSIKILNTLTQGTSYLLPPVVVIQYAELTSSQIGQGTIVQTSFESQYRMNLDSQIQGIWIAVGVLSGLGLILAFSRASVWQTRSGREFVDLYTIGKTILYIFNILATTFFIVLAGVSVWWLIFFKRQDAIYLVTPTTAQQVSFTALVAVVFSLKTCDILHLIFRQSIIDIFFLDWEKPKGEKADTVSVWRSYFVANEFNEIQTYRRVNPTVQLLFVLFLLKVINLENIAAAQPGVNLFPSSSDFQSESSGILRVGIAFSMWAASGAILYLIYKLFYERFVEDKILNFIDLCSVSNISVFILMYNHYGYYIHGRSPHGSTDVNMKDMLLNLERESKQMIGTRGLQASSDDQLFIVRIGIEFRRQYQTLLQNYRNRIRLQGNSRKDDKESDVLMASYRNLNDFLCAFINHALVNYNYIVLDRTFWEKVFNYEFRVGNPSDPQGNVPNILFVDKDRTFTSVLFAGYEGSLFMWNMSTFLLLYYLVPNPVLAAVVTYLLNLFATKMRSSIGRKNLALKTLIPKNFLI